MNGVDPPRSQIGPPSPTCATTRSIWRRVAARPKGMTSTGKGKAPRQDTSLRASAMTTMRREAAATIFSRSSAPPPPLIRLRSGAISSAPSTVRSSSGSSSRVAAECRHLSPGLKSSRTSQHNGCRDPRRLSLQQVRRKRAPSSRARPSLMPGLTNSSAALAAALFWRSVSAVAVMSVASPSPRLASRAPSKAAPKALGSPRGTGLE